MYLNGYINNVPQYEIAHKYFVLAADKGHVNAMFYAGVDFLLGRGVSQNMGRALYYIENAAQENDEWALNLLGSMYCYGKYQQKKDPRKAFVCFWKNAHQGNADAQYNLGKCYMDGFGTEKDMKKAFYWLKTSAKNGSSNGCYGLAICYKYGYGVSVNPQEFFKNMMISANLGNIPAIVQIGLCYMNGDGVEKNECEAVNWFIYSANKGDSFGQFWLGQCFLHGIGTDKNEQTAIAWLKKAADAGYSPAIDTLNKIKK